jgi:hypothetical protein
VSGKGYVYPISGHTTPGRIDQGQDFVGAGSVLAIGRAKIIRLGAPGWPEGGGVLYKLLEGPHRGQYVYNYEGLTPTVKAGQIVEAGQKIANRNAGGSIELGWANAAGEPISHAEYTKDGTQTKGGKHFATFLTELLSPHNPYAESSFGPLGTAEEAVNKPIGAIAGVIEGGASKAGEAAGSVAGEVVSGITGDISSHAPALMLNIGLIFGGAFLLYYGAGLVLGAKKPGTVPGGPALRRFAEGTVAK